MIHLEPLQSHKRPNVSGLESTSCSDLRLEQLARSAFLYIAGAIQESVEDVTVHTIIPRRTTQLTVRTLRDSLRRSIYYGRPAQQMRTLYFCPVVSIFLSFLFLA